MSRVTESPEFWAVRKVMFAICFEKEESKERKLLPGGWCRMRLFKNT